MLKLMFRLIQSLLKIANSKLAVYTMKTVAGKCENRQDPNARNIHARHTHTQSYSAKAGTCQTRLRALAEQHDGGCFD